MILSDVAAARVRRVARMLLPWLLLVAVLGNIGITIRYHAGTSHAIQFSDSGDLADLIDSTYPEMRYEYGMYAELGRIAPGSTLELPPGHPLDLDRLRFLAGVIPVDGNWYPDDAVGSLSPTASAPLWVEDHLITYEIVSGMVGEPYGAVRSRGLLLIAPVRLLEPAEATG